MNAFARIADGLQNIVANLGTSRDKSASSYYVADELNDLELTAAFRGSSIARNIVEYPANDACREWREWNAESTDISAIEAEEKRLGVQAKVLKALTRARLFGGAAIFIGTGEADLTKPLNPARLRKGGLRYLTVLDRRELSAGEIERDPSMSNYGMPVDYTINTTGGRYLQIHPSRLVLLRGEEMPDNSTAEANHGWGDSVLQTVLNEVTKLDATAGNIASLVFEAKVDVIRIKNFTKNLEEGGSAYERMMLRRFALANTAKGINGALMLDKEEEYDQKSANFSTLPDILDRFMQLVSAASGIPATRLFGMAPAGLNSTGEGDLRNYYDAVKQTQTLSVEPALTMLDECLIFSALGSRPADVFYNWRPLWQMSAKERAEISERLANVAKTAIETEAVEIEPMGEALVNALTETGAFPGLESAVAKFYGTNPREIDEVEETETLTGAQTEELTGAETETATSDAAPRTLYVRRDVLNAAEIIAWAKGEGFKTTLPADDMHVTIAFSRTPVDWMKMGQDWDSQMEIEAGGPRLMDAFGETGDAKVLLFSSSHLAWRHEDMKREGATWDHGEYQPHITISYDPDAPALDNVEPYRGRILLGPEIFEEINPEWMKGIKES